ncbi:dynein axonemal light chain 1 isoform X2 [Schistocerca gregaria]|uniref:dynein axonemal light chain 1 isoform X2 n=1 Tax=Schistocerca gregaria TaxID=7010 RepID=UPI00211DDCC3|nr:dynein axonemal light chain 1 isoform X2 [Schistocerca gregaria]
MAKATTIKDALKRWEEKYEMNPADATDVNLCFQWPFIEKMDNSLAVLVNCRKLSLSTNMIEKIAGEGIGDTLEELWISYNFIEKIKSVSFFKKLRVLYMSNNVVKDWSEFNRLQEIPHLEDLLFVGNPLYDALEEAQWRAEATRRLPNLKKLDGEPVIRVAGTAPAADASAD